MVSCQECHSSGVLLYCKRCSTQTSYTEIAIMDQWHFITEWWFCHIYTNVIIIRRESNINTNHSPSLQNQVLAFVTNRLYMTTEQVGHQMHWVNISLSYFTELVCDFLTHHFLTGQFNDQYFGHIKLNICCTWTKLIPKTGCCLLPRVVELTLF